jgi:hypothetical protein
MQPRALQRPHSTKGRVTYVSEPYEKLPFLSSRAKREISSISGFILAVLVEMTDAEGVCSKIYGMRPPPGHIKEFRAQREISGAAKECAFAAATISPGAIIPTLQRGNAVVAWMEHSAIRITI